MSTVISVENLGKKYTLSHQQREPYTALRDVITNGFSNFSKRIFSPFTHHPSPLSTSEDFWALKDVSFEVKQGDRIGIIGRNGAGKSTLLKILSRITEPTTGKVKIKGRVASLLEVGTGFHPELTGRENIFLNGAILGMGRAEIKKKFDEIVDFAEIEKFLDTPVKRYSSGMYVRLAFAVAAHLEPEILVVDEVLAVGDAQFQEKCLGKMEDVSNKEGRTVLFVSHNMGAISTLCTKAIMLGTGEIVVQGVVYDVIKLYNEKVAGSLTVNDAVRGGSGGIRIRNVWLEDVSGIIISHVEPLQAVCLCLDAGVAPLYQGGKKIGVGFGIDTPEGHRLFTTVSSWLSVEISTRGDSLSVRCCIPSLPFVSGRYLVSASILFQMETLDCVVNCVDFEVMDMGAFHVPRSRDQGYVSIPCRFDVQYV